MQHHKCQKVLYAEHKFYQLKKTILHRIILKIKVSFQNRCCRPQHQLWPQLLSYIPEGLDDQDVTISLPGFFSEENISLHQQIAQKKTSSISNDKSFSHCGEVLFIFINYTLFSWSSEVSGIVHQLVIARIATATILNTCFNFQYYRLMYRT